MSIETRKVEKILKQDEIVRVTCSRCGREVKRLPEGGVRASEAAGFPFDGLYVRGTLLSVGSMKISIATAWELCNKCGFELREWIGTEG